MESRELQRLLADVHDLIEQISYHFAHNQGDTQTLTRHTHSLKSLALQTGNTHAAELIHKIEGQLISNQPLGLEDKSQLNDLLNTLQQSFIEPQDNTDRPLHYQKEDRESQKVTNIATVDLFRFFSPSHWNLVLQKTAKSLSFYSLIFQVVDYVEEDLVVLRLDQVIQKYSQLGSIIIHQTFETYFLLGLLTENLESFPQRVPQVHLIQATQYTHQEVLHLKVLMDHDFINTTHETSHFVEDIKKFISIESKRLEKLVDCNLFGRLEYSAHILDTLKGVIFQALRNSLTHGMLTPEERKLIGKKNRGLIEITFFHSIDTYMITIEDDGEGFDPSQVHKESKINGSPIRPTDDRNSNHEHISFDSLSGRNLGLGMMQWYVEKLLAGTFTLQSSPTLGTKIQIQLSAQLVVHEGISVKIAEQGIFIASKDLYGLIPSIQELRPSRLGKYWYGTVYSKNYPLWILDTQNEPNKFDLKTLEMYNPENQKGLAILFCYNGELGILISCDTVARERVVQKANNKTVYSQAFEIPVQLLA